MGRGNPLLRDSWFDKTHRSRLIGKERNENKFLGRVFTFLWADWQGVWFQADSERFDVGGRSGVKVDFLDVLEPM